MLSSIASITNDKGVDILEKDSLEGYRIGSDRVVKGSNTVDEDYTMDGYAFDNMGDNMVDDMGEKISNKMIDKIRNTTGNMTGSMTGSKTRNKTSHRRVNDDEDDNSWVDEAKGYYDLLGNPNTNPHP
jgi:hypothetical protein